MFQGILAWNVRFRLVLGKLCQWADCWGQSSIFSAHDPSAESFVDQAVVILRPMDAHGAFLEQICVKAGKSLADCVCIMSNLDAGSDCSLPPGPLCNVLAAQVLLMPTGRCASRPGMWLPELSWSQRPVVPSHPWTAASTQSSLVPTWHPMASCTSPCSPS